MTPLVFAALYALVCVAAFVAGLRFFRMRKAPGGAVDLEHTRRFGRLMMMAATALLLCLGALIVHGDLKVTR